MPHTAIVTFTARPLEEILEHQGSRDWRLDAGRARYFEYLVCTQNRHNPSFRTPTAPHRAAFLIGRISSVVQSPERHDRWLMTISEYLECNIQNIWGKSGHLRYPVWYTTLEELGIDLTALPPFRPLPQPGLRGMGEIAVTPLAAPPDPPPKSVSDRKVPDDQYQAPYPARGQDAWERLDAILGQIDRIPDLPGPFDPLDWDRRGLPR
jgi:hypothetical protein